MGIVPAAPVVTVAYSSVISDPRPLRRCWLTGGIHLLVGFPLLLAIGLLDGFDWQTVEKVVFVRHYEDLSGLLFLLAAFADTVAGITLIVFPMRWRGLLMATLAPAVLVHFGGVLFGVGCVIVDDFSAQWGGLTAMLGVIVAVPCFLAMILGIIAFVRIKKSPPSGTPELAVALTVLENAVLCFLEIHQLLQKANRCLQRLLEEPKSTRKPLREKK